MDCRDCLNCKIIISRGQLRCSAGEWPDMFGRRKSFKIGENEKVCTNEGEVGIRFRNLFKNYEKCSSRISMD